MNKLPPDKAIRLCSGIGEGYGGEASNVALPARNGSERVGGGADGVDFWRGFAKMGFL